MGDAGEADAARALVQLKLGGDAGRGEEGELGGAVRGHGDSVHGGCHRVP